MKSKKPTPPTLTAAELKLIEQLRHHPELFERVRSILEITASAEETIKKADQIEALLIEDCVAWATPPWRLGPVRPNKPWALS